MRGSLALVLTAGCVSGAGFYCESDEQCAPGGRCEANRFCSRPDETCPSGFRYEQYASPGLADQCVVAAGAPDADNDAGAPDGPDDAADPSDGPPCDACDGPIVEDELLAWYPLDDPAGPMVLDMSGHGYHGTASGNVMFDHDGVIARCIVVQDDGQVRVDGLPALDAVTVEVWVKVDQVAATTGSGVVAKTGGNHNVDFGLLVDDDPEDALWWISASSDPTYGYRSIQSEGGSVPGDWAHLAATYDSMTGERRMYLDGLEIAASLSFGDPTPVPMTFSGPLLLGAYQWNDGAIIGHLKGRLDDVKIWRTVRTEEQICVDAGGVYDALGPACSLPK